MKNNIGNENNVLVRDASPTWGAAPAASGSASPPDFTRKGEQGGGRYVLAVVARHLRCACTFSLPADWIAHLATAVLYQHNHLGRGLHRSGDLAVPTGKPEGLCGGPDHDHYPRLRRA